MDEHLSVNSSDMSYQTSMLFYCSWTKLLSKQFCSNASIDIIAEIVISGLLEIVKTSQAVPVVLSLQQHARSNNTCMFQCVVVKLLKELESLIIFKAVCKVAAQMNELQVQKLELIFGRWSTVVVVVGGRLEHNVDGCCSTNGDVPHLSSCHNVCLCHSIAIFLLSWPYNECVPDTGISTLSTSLFRVCQDTSSGSSLLNEVETLRRQYRTLFTYHCDQMK